MPPLPSAVLLLVGFTLAHAVWSVSDLPPGELLAPLGIREVVNQRHLQRFEAQTQVAAIDAGKAQAVEWTRDSTPWAFARENVIREGGKEIDVIAVDFWAPGMSQPAVVIQRFQRYTVDGQFHLLGRMQIVVAGTILTDSAAAETMRSIEEGIAQHTRAGPLWATWR